MTSRPPKTAAQREILRLLLEEAQPLNPKVISEIRGKISSDSVLTSLICRGLVQRSEGYFLTLAGIDAAKKIQKEQVI